MVANEWPRGAHASDDRQPHILRAPEARLRGNPYLALTNVSCAYRQGVLTSRGYLSSSSLKRLAHKEVGQVEGAERIDNPIKVIAPRHQDIAGQAPEAGCVDPDAGQAAARPPLEASALACRVCALLIALAEHGTKQGRRRLRAAGCDHHLTKRVDAALLLQLLARPVSGAAETVARREG